MRVCTYDYLQNFESPEVYGRHRRGMFQSLLPAEEREWRRFKKKFEFDASVE